MYWHFKLALSFTSLKERSFSSSVRADKSIRFMIQKSLSTIRLALKSWYGEDSTSLIIL